VGGENQFVGGTAKEVLPRGESCVVRPQEKAKEKNEGANVYNWGKNPGRAGGLGDLSTGRARVYYKSPGFWAERET